MTASPGHAHRGLMERDAIIRKTARDLRVPPHLADYTVECHAFSWARARPCPAAVSTSLTRRSIVMLPVTCATAWPCASSAATARSRQPFAEVRYLSVLWV